MVTTLTPGNLTQNKYWRQVSESGWFGEIARYAEMSLFISKFRSPLGPDWWSSILHLDLIPLVAVVLDVPLARFLDGLRFPKLSCTAVVSGKSARPGG